MNVWEVAGWTCFALTAVPAFIYMVVKFAVLAFYRAKIEGQRKPDNPHPFLKGKEGHG